MLQMYLESPICWPAARVLDLLLGSHTTQLYRREELRTLIELHASSPADATVDAADPALSGFESQILGNVLQLASIPARQSCLRSEDIYVVSDGIRVCDIDLARLLATGQSFLPVRRSSLFKDAANRSSHALVGYVTVAEVSAALKTPHRWVCLMVKVPPWSDPFSFLVSFGVCASGISCKLCRRRPSSNVCDSSSPRTHPQCWH